MSYVSERTWATGDVVAQSDLNQYLRDNVDYLKAISDGLSFSGAQVNRVAATSIPDATSTAITWTTEVFDYGGWYSSGSTLVVPAGAIPSGFTTIAVMVVARTLFASNSTGRRRIYVMKNGSAVASPSVSAVNGDETEINVTAFTTCVAADTISLEVYQNSGGSLNVSNTTITVVRFAPAA